MKSVLVKCLILFELVHLNLQVNHAPSHYVRFQQDFASVEEQIKEIRPFVPVINMRESMNGNLSAKMKNQYRNFYNMHFEKYNITYPGALETCHKSGKTVFALNPNDVLMKELATIITDGNHVWTNIRRSKKFPHIFYSPNGFITSNPFKVGEPDGMNYDEMCTVFDPKDRKLYDDSCESKHSYLCTEDIPFYHVSYEGYYDWSQYLEKWEKIKKKEMDKLNNEDADSKQNNV